MLTTLCTPLALSSFAAPEPGLSDGLLLRRIAEPNEGAFTILVPDRWLVRGGIQRPNALAAGGPLDAMEAKVDIAFLADEEGTVGLRRHPDTVRAHPGIGGGFWAEGSNYQGAVVQRKPPAKQWLKQFAEELHAGADGLAFVDLRALPDLARVHRRASKGINEWIAAAVGPGFTFTFESAGCVIEYREGGVHYREVLVATLVDMRGALTWKNTDTLQMRAPVKEFDRWAPVFDLMRHSVQLDENWVMKEAGGQRERASIVIETQRNVNRIAREIAASRAHRTAETQTENYLVLTGQEEYTNPHTGEVELDTNAWQHRWVTPDGSVWLTDEEDLDPNLLRIGNREDFERSPPRPRR